MVWVLACLPDV